MQMCNIPVNTNSLQSCRNTWTLYFKSALVACYANAQFLLYYSPLENNSIKEGVCNLYMYIQSPFSCCPLCIRIKFHVGFRYLGNECLFVPETCVFAYLGLALFSFRLMVKPAFVIWSIVSLIYSHLNIPYLRVYVFNLYVYLKFLSCKL